jgi:hypothetical protein
MIFVWGLRLFDLLCMPGWFLTLLVAICAGASQAPPFVKILKMFSLFLPFDTIS